MKVHNFEQGTPEWQQVRCGKFTASNFAKLFMAASTKGYQDYINNVVFERLTGKQAEAYTNEWMLRGSELEAEARISYESRTFNIVEQVGFVEYSEWIGASPDGLIDADGLIEIKCPKHTTVIEYLLSDKIPKDYYWQMQGQMMVTDRKWCDYFIYHPDLEPIIKRVKREPKDIVLLIAELDKAIIETQNRIRTIGAK
ncbi:MAG: lambda exonuclease family protein [Bacteroidota bacterium]